MFQDIFWYILKNCFYKNNCFTYQYYFVSYKWIDFIEMGSDNNSKLESKIRFLKQQLSALGYEYEFTVDCLPLLENLVADLIQTSDTLKHYKELSQGCLQVYFF